MENGTSRSRYLISFTLVSFYAIFLLSGCLEHRYLYKFNLDGSCDFTYNAKGDSADLYGDPPSLPDSLIYQIKHSTELDTNGSTQYVLKATRHLPSGVLPTTMGLKEVPWTEVYLHHPTTFRRIPLFLCTISKFKLTFISRHRTLEEGDRWHYIPEECRPLEDPQDSTLSDTLRAELEKKYAAGMVIWTAERYKMRFKQILKQALSMHPNIKVPPAWVDSALVEVDSLINTYASGVKIVDLNSVNLEWWKDLSPYAQQIIAENLNLLGSDSTLQGEIIHVGEILELRHQVTEDLGDENFEIRADMPGRILSSTTKVMDKGVLVWKVSTGEFDDADVVLEASSLYVYTYRVVGLLLVIVLYFVYRKYKKGKAPLPDGPPPFKPIK
jgi:hypothetical protein